MSHRPIVHFFAGLSALCLGIPCAQAEPTALLLESPTDYQVVQRSSFERGTVLISGKISEAADVDLLVEGNLTGPHSPEKWQPLVTLAAGDTAFTAKLNAAPATWYQLEVRARHGETITAHATVAHVGIGDVFVIAGQSNSANHGAEKQQTQSGLVASFDGKHWQLANDPQPGASGGGGSFIPPFGDGLAELFQVPIGIVATGVGATSVREWLPRGSRFPNPPTITGNVTELPNGEWECKGTIFDNFVARLKPLGPKGFRAVLWHQGESDANQRDQTRTLPGELYQKYLEQLIHDSRREVGWEFPWFVAQASYHTPDDPGSEDIRAAQKALWDTGIALEGPDSDALTGDNRDNGGKGVHFSGPGLRNHGARWVEKVKPWLTEEFTKTRPVRVFILAGQSNMEGQGVVEMDHPEYYNGGKGNLVWSMEHSASKDRMQHLRNANGEWVVRDDVEISFKAKDTLRSGGLTIGYTGYGGSSHIGPELQLGHLIGDFFREPVLLIKTAWGGKSLHKDFRPPSSGGETGPYYRQMIDEVRAALALADEDSSWKLTGFIWMQGWNDMVSAEATDDYAENLVNLANDVRAEFESPKLPIVIGELGNGGPAKAGSGMERFRAAQKQGAERIQHAVFVPTTDFARPAEFSPNRSHGHHWFGNAESYFLVGDALGHAMLEFFSP